MPENESLTFRLFGQDVSATRTLNRTASAADRVGSHIEDMGRRTSRAAGVMSTALGTTIGYLGAKGLGAAFGAVKEATFGFNNQLEQATIAFTTMLGSGAKAKSFLDELAKFARTTPFEFPELIDSSQRLIAMGIEAKNVVPTMTAIGDAVAGLGGSKDKLDRVITAIGQIQAKGKLQAEEMRQLTEAGIPAWDILAKKIGKSVPDAMKAVSKGAVDSKTAIDALTTGMEKRFGGLMAKQSQTLGGAISNIKDSLSQGLGRALLPLFQGVERGAQGLAAVLGSDGFRQGAERFSQALAEAFTVAGRAVGVFVEVFRGGEAQSTGAMGRLGAAAGVVRDTIHGLAGAVAKVLPVVSELARVWGQHLQASLARWADFARAQVLPTLSSIGQFVSTSVLPALRALGTFVLGTVLPAFQKISEAVLGALLPALRGLMDRISDNRQHFEQLWAVVRPLAAFLLGTVAPIVGRVLAEAFRAAIAVIGLAIAIVGGFVGAVSKIVTVVHDAGAQVIAFFKRLPGSIKAAFGDAGDLLYGVGRDIIHGLINGLKSLASKPVDIVKDIGHGMTSGISHVLGRKSPSRVFHAIGLDVTAGLANGLLAGRGRVSDAMDALGSQVVKQGLTVEGATVRADSLRGQLDDVIGHAQEMRATFANALSGGSLGDLFGGGDGDGIVSTDAALAKFRGLLGRAREFAADLGTLRGMGLSGPLLQQIMAAGLDTGDAIAKALIGAGSGTVGEFNDASSALTDLAGSGVDGIVNSLFGGAASALGGELVELGRHFTELSDTVVAATTAIAATFPGLQPTAALSGAASRGAATPTSVVVNLNVHGSVTSERDLIETVRQGLAKEALRGR